MKYENKSILKSGMKVWASAYTTDNNKESMGLICKPVYGQICDVHYESFIPFKKNGELRSVSSAVSLYARMFADTYEESVELYNDAVQKRIDWLSKMIDETKQDFLTLI